MALVIEDGSGKVEATSYADVAETRAYADARGFDLPAEDAKVEQHLILAAEYLNSKNWKGTQTNPFQRLAWPRSNVWLYTFEIKKDEIPLLVKEAQMRLVCEMHKGVELQPNFTSAQVQSEQVGPISTSYFEAPAMRPAITAVDDMLTRLTVGSNGLKVVRA